VSTQIASPALGERLVSFAWQEWAQMGLLAAPSHASPWAQDPEAMIVFTLEVARDEPRLFDELLDWMLHNEARLSVRRLRAMCIDDTDRRLTNAAIGWLGRHRPQARLGPRADAAAAPPARLGLEPLFRTEFPVREPDPDFAAAGYLRPVLVPSGKSVAPDLMTSINLAFRLRAILGVGIRSEVVRIMLSSQPTFATAQVLASASGYSKRNVHDALRGLVEARVFSAGHIEGERRYRIDTEAWAALLGRDIANLPVSRDWPPLLGSLRMIYRLCRAQSGDETSDYMRSSETRQLLVHLGKDLGPVGIEIDPALTSDRAPAELERVLEEALALLACDAAAR
jgi:hypothetical protein